MVIDLRIFVAYTPLTPEGEPNREVPRNVQIWFPFRGQGCVKLAKREVAFPVKTKQVPATSANSLLVELMTMLSSPQNKRFVKNK